MSTDILARMHTAEHILTAVMGRSFGSPRNLEMHLGPKKTKCDYEIDRPWGARDAHRVEEAVNALIDRDLTVAEAWIPRGDADEQFSLWKVPADAERIRIVSIGEFDRTPCSGAHVCTTRQIGRFVIRSASMKDDHTVRIRFALDAPK